MKRVTLTVEEQVTYETEVTVFRPDDMSDETFNGLVERTMKEVQDLKGRTDQFAETAERLGLQVAYRTYPYPEHPTSHSLSVTKEELID